MGAVTHRAHQVLDEVFERDHRGDGALGVGDECQVGVVAAQPGQPVGQRQRRRHAGERADHVGAEHGVPVAGIVDVRQHILDVQVADEGAVGVGDREA